MKRKLWFCSILLVMILCLLTACEKKQKKEDTIHLTTENTTAVELTTTECTTEEVVLQMDENGFYMADDYVIVTADIANARVSANETADIYRMVPLDTVLKRTGYNDSWTRVIIDATSFYVPTSTVEVTERKPEGEDDEEEEGENSLHVIVIDPCKQDTLTVATDQLGPGSDETKQAVSTGAVSLSGTKESEINLVIAELLKTELQNRGYEVVLTRDNNKADVSNKERAEIANDANADIFVRIQLAESSDTTTKGMLCFCPAIGNPYNGHLYEDSYILATRLLQGVIEQTENVNHGILETDQMTAMNWSKVPVATISVGYLSSYEDEMNLLDVEYQNKLVQGLANGIEYYFIGR